MSGFDLREVWVKRYPYKFLYTTIALLSNIVRFPFWCLYFLPPSLRQHPTWSWKQALGVRFMYSTLDWLSTIEIFTSTSLEPKGEGDRFITIPVSRRPWVYTGVLMEDKEIQPTDVGATWYMSRLHPGEEIKPNETIVLHLHGGAFVHGDGREANAGYCARVLLHQGKASRVLCPQYRLASNPGGRFPAGMQDTITAYAYLVNDLKIPAEQIILSGDSAGGNLALGLLKYLSEHGKETGLPRPACAWLWSPWINPEAAADPANLMRNPRRNTDYIAPPFLSWSTKMLVWKSPFKLSHEYISHRPFQTDVPMFFVAGGAEILMGEVLDFASKMKNIDGNTVEIWVDEGKPHDIVFAGTLCGFKKEGRVWGTKGREFAERHMKALQ